MTSKSNRIRRGVAGLGLGLAVFGGGFVLSGLPAANAGGNATTFICSNGTVSSFVLQDQVKSFEQQNPGFTCKPFRFHK
jgi:hypothetical protein